MVYKMRWSPRAASSFEDICNYIARDSEFYAAIFAKKISAAIEAIPQFPKAGRIVPEYEDENLREKIYENYRIVYRLKALKKNLLKLLLFVMALSHWIIFHNLLFTL